MKTGLITSDTFQNHDTGPGHPEQIARVSVIIENFKKLNNKNILWKKPTIITDDIIKDTHDANYLNFVKNSFPNKGFFSLDGDTVFEDSEIGMEIVKQRHLKEVKSLKDSASGKETKESIGPGKRNKKVKNRFQFCDRACQTYNRKIRHFGVSTVPPSAVTMTGSVTQWSIHDEFMKEFERT